MAFVGSIAGWIGFPSAAAYVSAKFALEGFVKCLAQGMAMFGLKAVLFEPGYARTNALKQGNLKHEPGFLSAYDQYNQGVLQFDTASFGQEPGDPAKIMARMIDIFTATGAWAGQDLPLRLPIGSNALAAVTNKCQTTLQKCEKWKEVITSTDLA